MRIQLNFVELAAKVGACECILYSIFVQSQLYFLSCINLLVDC